ncbi:MAG: hypothetical protein ACLFPM_03180 [Candidatus Izemoplasmatales bacterium]
MKVTLCNESTQNKQIEMSKNIWTGKMMITIDNQALKKVKRNMYVYTDESGQTYDVLVSGNEITGLILKMDGREIHLLRKLSVFEIIISILPAYLVFIGGALGGALGFLGAFVMASLCRQTNNMYLKIVYSFSVTLLTTTIWYILASMIFNLI